jgi:hypothetical protein
VVFYQSLRRDRGPRAEPDRSGDAPRLYVGGTVACELSKNRNAASVGLWNKATQCGCKRDVQRKRYDDRRREVLPKHRIKVVVIECDSFDTKTGGKLKKVDRDKDREVVRSLLQRADLVV